MFGDIQTDYANLRHGCLPLVVLNTSTLAHRCRRRGVHPIIKGSVGQTRVLHYLRHSHVVEAALAKQTRGGGQDSYSMLRNLLSAHFHVGHSECLDFIQDRYDECNHD